MADWSIEVVELPEVAYVARHGEVVAEELPRWIRDAVEVLMHEEGMRAAGPPFTRHLGAGEGDTTRVEVGLPVRHDGTDALPGGPAARVALHGEAAAYPAILDAYQAAREWAGREGRELAGPAHEVYLGPGEVAVLQPLTPAPAS